MRAWHLHATSRVALALALLLPGVLGLHRQSRLAPPLVPSPRREPASAARQCAAIAFYPERVWSS